MTVTYKTATQIMNAIAFTLLRCDPSYADDIDELNEVTKEIFCDYCDAEDIHEVEEPTEEDIEEEND